jgi:hypothetical protein
MVNIFKRLGRNLSSGVRWVGRQVKHAGQLQNSFLNTVNKGAKSLGRQVSKLPGGEKVVDAVKNVIQNVKVPIINKSVGDLYQTGKQFASGLENTGRAVNDVGYSLQSDNRAKQLAAMRNAMQRARETASNLKAGMK